MDGGGTARLLAHPSPWRGLEKLGRLTCVSVPVLCGRFPVPLLEGHCINNTCTVSFISFRCSEKETPSADNEGNKFLQFP